MSGNIEAERSKAQYRAKVDRLEAEVSSQQELVSALKARLKLTEDDLKELTEKWREKNILREPVSVPISKVEKTTTSDPPVPAPGDHSQQDDELEDDDF